MRVLAASLLLSSSGLLGVAPHLRAEPGPEPALVLARRLLASRGVGSPAGEVEPRGLYESELAGLLAEGLPPRDLTHLAALERPPAALPLAPDLQLRLDELLAHPYRDREALAWVETLGPDLAALAARLHLENEASVAYSLRLPGAFARGAVHPGEKLEVRILPRDPARPGEVSAPAEALLGRVLPAFVGHPRLDVARHSPADLLAERYLEGAVDLGLGLDLAMRGGEALREHYARQLRSLGIWVFADGRVLARSPQGPRPGYVERHVVELVRRFELLRSVLSRPLAAVHAPGEDRRLRAAAARIELDAAARRLGGYVETWRRNLAVLDGLAAGRPLVEMARAMGMARRDLEERVDLLRTRLGPEGLRATRSSMAVELGEVLRQLELDLRGFVVRYRQVLPASAPPGPEAP